MRNFFAVVGAIESVLVVAAAMFLAACWIAGVMDRRERYRKAARRAEVEERLADVEWLMIRAALDETPHPATIAHIARWEAEGLEQEWREWGGVA